MAEVAALKSASSYALDQARVDLAAAHRLAARDGLNEGTWNHFSLVAPGDSSKILITPTIQHWSTITASNLALVGRDEDRDALKAADPHGLWVGYRIHYPLHSARPDAKCVLHAHPPYATAFSMVEGIRFEPAEQNALEFYGKVSYTDEFDAGMEVGLDQGHAMAQALGEEATVLILRNHGVVVVGATVAVAYTRLYLLERACHVQLLARQLGPLTLIPENRRNASGDESKELHFAAMKRVLDREEPSYSD